MNRHFLMLLIAATFSISFSFAQIKATTEDGNTVLLMADGTWKYDSTLITSDSIPISDTSVVATIDSSLCSNWVSITEDKMTGRKTISNKSDIIISNGNNKGLSFIMLKKEEILVWVIEVVGASKCIDEGDKINILFTDGNRLELKNMGDFECKGRSTVYLGDLLKNKNAWKMLMEKNIATMRVWTHDGYVQVDFSPENRSVFQRTINCLGM